MLVLKNHFVSEVVPFVRYCHICIYVGMSVMGQNAQAELCVPNTRMIKVNFGWLNPTCDTRVIHFDYTLEQL